jgi:crotonyl-CoA carboxylase/reductase
MTSATPQTPPGRLTPSFDHAEVLDVMRRGVITCTPDTGLDAVARIMAMNHVHAVVVSALGSAPAATAWGIVSDADITRFAATADMQTAGAIASTDLVTVPADESLERAAELMAEHEISHVVAVDDAGLPVGVLSSLDIAAAIGGV